MISGNFTSIDFAPTGTKFYISDTILDESTQLFRFTNVEGQFSDVYRITNKFYGPTRSLTYDKSYDRLSFNETNDTATNQYWAVELRGRGDYFIGPIHGGGLRLTADNKDRTVSVANDDYFCAWCLVKDGDFIGRQP